MNKYIKIGLFILLCQTAGLLATPITIEAIPTWYDGLTKPPFSPPNWLFGPVWTLLYTLMGIAGYLVWEKRGKTAEDQNTRRAALSFFAAQLALNFLWSVLFFGLRNPELALADILVLWTLILMCILTFQKLSKAAAYLMVPYFMWVSFATLLNFSLAVLN